VVSRVARPGIACDGSSLTLHIDVDTAGQALSATVGLLAAWAGAMSTLRIDH
jgi:hypothetical protein